MGRCSVTSFGDRYGEQINRERARVADAVATAADQIARALDGWRPRAGLSEAIHSALREAHAAIDAAMQSYPLPYARDEDTGRRVKLAWSIAELASSLAYVRTLYRGEAGALPSDMQSEANTDFLALHRKARSCAALAQQEARDRHSG